MESNYTAGKHFILSLLTMAELQHALSCMIYYLCKKSIYHFSTQGVIESFKQLDHGALSTAAASHKSQCLSLVYSDFNSLEDCNIWPRWIVEDYILNCYITTKRFLGLKQHS